MILICLIVALASAQETTFSVPSSTDTFGCDTAAITACADYVTKCLGGGKTDLNGICPCYGGYVSCMNKVTGCGDAVTNAVDTFKKACYAVKCPSTQCDGQDSGSSGNCDTAAITACADSVTKCLNGKTDLNGICPCYGGYTSCISKVTGCGDAIPQSIDSFKKACLAIRCPSTQCDGQDSGNSNNCDTAAITACADNVVKCLNGKTDLNSICPCYGGYGSCISKVTGCGDATTTAVTSFKKACLAVKCPSTQCEAQDPTVAACTNNQQSLCAYDGTESIVTETDTIVTAAKLGVSTSVTTRICASLRSYLACSRRVFEAGKCDTSKLDITYQNGFCRNANIAAMLQSISCDACSALTGVVVAPTTSPRQDTTPSDASRSSSSSSQLLTIVVLAIATVLFIR